MFIFFGSVFLLFRVIFSAFPFFFQAKISSVILSRTRSPNRHCSFFSDKHFFSFSSVINLSGFPRNTKLGPTQICSYLFKTRLTECVETGENFWNGVSLVTRVALGVERLSLFLGRVGRQTHRVHRRRGRRHLAGWIITCKPTAPNYKTIVYVVCFCTLRSFSKG